MFIFLFIIVFLSGCISGSIINNKLHTSIGTFDLSTAVMSASRVEENPKCKDMKYNITTYRFSESIGNNEEINITFEHKALIKEEQTEMFEYLGGLEYDLWLTKRPYLNCYTQDDSTVISFIKDTMLEAPSGEELNLMDELENNINGEVGQPLDVDRIVFGGELKNGFFLEAGTYDGEFNSDSLYFEANHNWSGLLVEAVPEFYELLKYRNRNATTIMTCLAVEKRPHYANFDFLAALRDGLERDSMSGISTEKDEEFQQEMQCMPVYSILQAMGNPTVNYFSLDVEGAEFAILLTIPWDKVNIQVMSIETHLLGYVFPGSREELIMYLDSVGYRHIPWGHTATNKLRYNAEDPEESTRDDLFVRKDIPLKMTQQEKEALDRKENRIWPVKNANPLLAKAYDGTESEWFYNGNNLTYDIEMFKDKNRCEPEPFINCYIYERAQNLVVIRIDFAENYFAQKNVVDRAPMNTKIAGYGGTIGLFLGFSFMSIAEFVVWIVSKVRSTTLKIFM